MHLLKVVLLYLLDQVVKVKNSETHSSPQNVTMDSRWTTPENDTVGQAFKTMNFYRANMNEFLYRKFLLSSLMSQKKRKLTNKNDKFNQTERRRAGDRIYNGELDLYKSWLIGSKGSKTKDGISVANFAGTPKAANKVETKAKDKDIAAATAFSTDHGNVMPLRNYTYPPSVYKKKHNKIIINGPDPKGILQRKLYPANQLSKEQLKSLGAILLKNRYFANRIMGEQRPKNSESDNLNGDYTVNLPSADYGSPIYTNMATENTILYITTEAPIVASPSDSFNFATSTSANVATSQSNQISLMEMLNPPQISGFSSISPIPLNPGPYMMNPAASALNSIYGLPNQMSSMMQPTIGYPNPPYLMNSMAAGGRPVYSAMAPEFSYSSDGSSSTGDDSMPYIVEEHPHCPCKENGVSSGDAGVADSDDSVDFMDSDIYDAILTTIAFMAFGTYFISMMMKINEKNPGATLMVVENGGNMESGRTFESIHDDFYLNGLMEEVMLFIDGFQELMLEQPRGRFNGRNITENRL